ncbi:MAG: NADH:flavin oxidoreductase/NADH oxidase [Microbacteriaceae bacterium]
MPTLSDPTLSDPTLFTPLTLRGVTLRNRIGVPALCQYSALARDGVPTDWHLVHLGSFAIGGAGLVIAEASAVVPEGRISPHDTGIWNDEQQHAWARIVDFLHAQGAAAGMQLAHAGRKASVYPEWGADARGSVPVAEGGWPTVSASDIPFEEYAVPRALDIAEVREQPAIWARAARRAVDAGFDLVEIHAAHGYLLHQFLSPLSNTRTDEYGGSLENRSRLLVEIVRAVRAEVGEDVPVLVRFSATDWADDRGEPSWNLEQTSEVARRVAEAGADLIDVSSGGLVGGVRIPVAAGYQVRFAETVRRDADVPTAAVGLITEIEQAREIVESGRSDMVLLGRAMMRDPHWPLRAAHELGVEIDYWAPQYERARPGAHGW